MRFTFEPGDGSFEVLLQGDEKVPAEWNIPQACIIREVNGKIHMVKPIGETLKLDRRLDDFDYQS